MTSLYLFFKRCNASTVSGYGRQLLSESGSESISFSVAVNPFCFPNSRTTPRSTSRYRWYGFLQPRLEFPINRQHCVITENHAMRCRIGWSAPRMPCSQLMSVP